MAETPPDWVLIEAAKRGRFGLVPVETSRAMYEEPITQHHHVFRALCDMIAKHEQPTVDPDVEAVKRILLKWNDAPIYDWNHPSIAITLERAVAQYKTERGNAD